MKDWNKIYKGESESSDFRQLSDEELNRILSYFSVKRALDLGCGRGELLAQLNKRGIQSDGVDISPVVKDMAIDKDLDIIIGDIEKKGSFGREYDIVFLKFVLAFIEDKSALYKKIHSSLKLGGGLVIISPIGKGDIFVEKSQLPSEGFEKVLEEVWYEGKEGKLSLYIYKKVIHLRRTDEIQIPC